MKKTILTNILKFEVWRLKRKEATLEKELGNVKLRLANLESE